MACFLGKTELAKQVARYMHKDIKKVSYVPSDTHTHFRHTYIHLCLKHVFTTSRLSVFHWCLVGLKIGTHSQRLLQGVFILLEEPQAATETELSVTGQYVSPQKDFIMLWFHFALYRFWAPFAKSNRAASYNVLKHQFTVLQLPFDEVNLLCDCRVSFVWTCLSSRRNMR